MLTLPTCSDTDNTNDELHNDHTGSANYEQLATAESLNGVERDGRRAYVDEGGDQGDEKGIIDGAQTLEEDGAEVEDEVDTGQLLHCLHQDTWSTMVSLPAERAASFVYIPTVVRRVLLLPFMIEPWKQLAQLPIQLVCGTTCSSYS